MSAKELAAITRIHPRLVYSLEADEYDDLPAEIFVRGFLRNCAREVHLDPDELITLYERYTGNRPRPNLAEELAENEPEVEGLLQERRLPRAGYLIVLIAIALGLGLALLIFGDTQPEQLSNHAPTWHELDR